MLFFRRKPKQSRPEATPLTFSWEMAIPLIKLSGVVPPGTDGNDTISVCWDQISRSVDILAAPGRTLVYDFTDLRYSLGDHLGAFLWVLPTLLDGVSIMIATSGKTRGNLESLYEFIGSWLPVGFFGSVDEIRRHVRDQTDDLQQLCVKRERCTQFGRVIPPSETATKIVLFGSRQTGRQYKTRQFCKEYSDTDAGVVGGPKELAILALKMDQPDHAAFMEHPPTKTFASVQEAMDRGFLVILPK
jgi:hypothetical protein